RAQRCGEPAQTMSAAAGRGWLGGLALAPCATLVAGAAFPALHAGSGGAGLVAFGGAAIAALSSLATAARAELPPRVAVAVASCSIGVVAVFAVVRPAPLIMAAVVNAALVTLAHAVGGAIGRRVAHPGHLLPACAVAAAADLASVLHPLGPNRAIASSGRAL